MDNWEKALLDKCRSFVGDEPMIAISDTNPLCLNISQSEAYIIMKMLERLEPSAEIKENK